MRVLFLLILLQHVSSTTLLPNPILYVNFESGIARDLSGNKHSVSIAGLDTNYTSIAYNSTTSNFAYHHTNTSLVEGRIITDLILPADFTISLWIFPEHGNKNEGSDFSLVEQVEDTFTNYGNSFDLSIADLQNFYTNPTDPNYNTGYVTFALQDDNTFLASDSSQQHSLQYFKFQQWHHLCITYNSTTLEGDIYIDGVLAQTATLSGNPYVPTHMIGFGNQYSSYYGYNAYVGYIDEIRVYNTALTASQVQNLSSLAFATTNPLYLQLPLQQNISDVGPSNFSTSLIDLQSRFFTTTTFGYSTSSLFTPPRQVATFSSTANPSIYINVSGTALTPSFSFSIWVQAATDSGLVLFGSAGTTGDFYSGYGYQNNDPTGNRFSLGRSSSLQHQIATIYAPNATSPLAITETANTLSPYWRHYVMTYNATYGVLSLYLNASLVGQTNDSSYITKWQSGLPIVIGCSSTQVYGSIANANITDLRVYSIELTQSTVTQLFQSLVPPTTAPPTTATPTTAAPTTQAPTTQTPTTASPTTPSPTTAAPTTAAPTTPTPTTAAPTTASPTTPVPTTQTPTTPVPTTQTPTTPVPTTPVPTTQTPTTTPAPSSLYIYLPLQIDSIDIGSHNFSTIVNSSYPIIYSLDDRINVSVSNWLSLSSGMYQQLLVNQSALPRSFSIASWVSIGETFSYDMVIMGSPGAIGYAYPMYIQDSLQIMWVSSLSTFAVGMYSQGRTLQVVHSSTTTTVSPGTWQHIAITYDESTGNLRFYINGTLSHSATDSLFVTSWNSGLPFALSSVFGRGVSFTGSLVDVRVYSDVLTLSEISTLYSTPIVSQGTINTTTTTTTTAPPIDYNVTTTSPPTTSVPTAVPTPTPTPTPAPYGDIDSPYIMLVPITLPPLPFVSVVVMSNSSSSSSTGVNMGFNFSSSSSSSSSTGMSLTVPESSSSSSSTSLSTVAIIAISIASVVVTSVAVLVSVRLYLNKKLRSAATVVAPTETTPFLRVKGKHHKKKNKTSSKKKRNTQV